MGQGEAAHPAATWRLCTCLVPSQCPQACMCQACSAGVGGAKALIGNSHPAPSRRVAGGPAVRPTQPLQHPVPRSVHTAFEPFSW